jgi:hypothetical protein
LLSQLPVLTRVTRWVHEKIDQIFSKSFLAKLIHNLFRRRKVPYILA